MSKANTRFSYLYRDASNYKAFHENVLEGRLTQDDLLPFLEDSESFIPHDVGLKELQPSMTNFPSEGDHVYHAIDEIEETNRKPTKPVIKASELIERFKQAHAKGWQVMAAMKRLGLSDV